MSLIQIWAGCSGGRSFLYSFFQTGVGFGSTAGMLRIGRAGAVWWALALDSLRICMNFLPHSLKMDLL